MKRAALLVFGAIIAACGGGGGGGGAPVVQAVPLLVAAGMVRLEPAPVDTVSATVDLGRLGFSDVVQVYDLTTPVDEPFSFDILSRNAGNEGSVRLSLRHAADAGTTPAGGAETLVAAGIVPSASGATGLGGWFNSFGAGFARITLSGAIDTEQVVAVEAENDDGRTTALIRLRVGAESPINVPAKGGTDYTGVLGLDTIYSSDSYQFGLPTCAISGDRTTIVAYEGDRADPFRFDRYELRLQHDAATGAVTGGAALDPNPDFGNWRDHEVAALFNVVALVHCGMSEVTLRLSFDRGATFGQTATLARVGTRGTTHLATVAMAADYGLAVAFWQSHDTGTELVLVEAEPSAFDGTGSPTQFRLDPPQILYRTTKDLTPVLMGLAWSEGGDLVLGYGFTSFEWNPDTMETTTRTQFRCAVRLFGGDVRDTLVEEDVTVARDPSVALVGQGASMRIFYAYEGRDGVRTRTSDDAGVTWSAPMIVGDPFSYMPSIFARDQEGALRVDLLFLTWADFGTELHLRHWDDFGTTPFADYRLTVATMEGEFTDPPPLPGDPALPRPDVGLAPPLPGPVITQVSWFGYDATLDGDDIVVVVDEETTDPFEIMILGVDVVGRPEGDFSSAPAAGGFEPAEPPPLAPGLTEPVPAPDPSHRHQLKLMRLD